MTTPDKNGRQLAVGDRVTIAATITQLPGIEGSNGVNCELRTDGFDREGEEWSGVVMLFNTRGVEYVASKISESAAP